MRSHGVQRAVALVIFFVIIGISLWLYYENMNRNRTLQLRRAHLRAAVRALLPLCAKRLAMCGSAGRPQLRRVDEQDGAALRWLQDVEELRAEGDYYFVLDRDARCWANGGNPQLALRGDGVRPGLVLGHQTHHDGEKDNSVQRLVQMGVEGGGFVEYKWNSPHHQERRSKVSWVEHIPGTDLFLGCGMYT
jgi:signal transduction histidine kinase